MPRYIDAEIFDKNLMMEVYLADDEDFTKAFVRGMELVKKAEKETPTADVQEVKHGKWIVKDLTPYCSVCHRPSEYECDGVHSKPLFCPHCGAKMDLEESDGKRI